MDRDVRYTRVLESFEDCPEIVPEAARLFVERVEPGNGMLTLIGRALEHRTAELRATYGDQKDRERNAR